MKPKKTSPSLSVVPRKALPFDIDEDQQLLATALADVSIALNSSLHLDEVLDRILENLGKVVSYKTANIMLINGTKTRTVRSRGYDLLGTKDLIMSQSFEISEIINFIKMIETKQPILSYYPHLEQDWDVLAESEWIKSHIAAPIISDDSVIGFLNCDSDIAGFFDRHQLNVMKIFACEAGLAIRNARLFDASTRLGTKLKLINDLTRQALEATSVDQILKILPEKLVELSEGQNVYISKWDEATQTVTGWAATGKNKEEYISGKSSADDLTITAKILENQQGMVVENVSTSSEIDSKFHSLYLEKTLLCLPLAAEDIKFGAVIIGYANTEQITEEIRSLAEYAALQISAAIAKIHLLELERNQSSQLAHANALIGSFNRVATAIKSGVDTKNIMTTVGIELELLKIHSIVALKPVDSDTLTLTYSSVHSKIASILKKISGNKEPEMTASIDMAPIFRSVIDDQQSQFIDNPEELLALIVPSHFKPVWNKFIEAMQVTSETKCILAPLVMENRSIGIVSLWGEGLKKIDIQAATIFGGQVAVAIENARLLQEVQRLAITDELTNVLNRRGFDDVSTREFVAAKRYSRPLSLIMLDIDRFKAINDVYGHPIGDEILIEIAARARTKIRETDYISRYGGEEFLILLIEQKPDNAKTVAERIRKSVADQPFDTSVGKITVTISAGITGMNTQTASISMMIKTVDKALYRSKENGRNRVTMIDKI